MAVDVLVNFASTTVSSGGTDAPASGTVETWTVASAPAFPSVLSGVTQCRIQDPAASTEIMLVTNIAATSLTSALASGTAYTTLAVVAVPQIMNSGDTLILGVGSTTQDVTLAASVAVGATSLSIDSVTPAADFAIDTPVTDFTTPGANSGGATWTVERGVEKTTPVIHTTGFTVDAVSTAASLSSPLPTVSAGLQSSSLYVPEQWTASSHSNTPTLNAISAGAFWLAGNATITGLGTKTPSQTAGAYMRLGIYLDNGSGFPGQLLVDAGQINGDSGADQELTFPGIPLQGGQWLWLAACAQGVTQSYRVINQNVQSGPVPLLAGNFDNSGSAGYLTTASTYAAGLPTPFPAASPNPTAVVSVIVFTS